MDFRLLVRNRKALVGSIGLLSVCFLAIAAPVLTHYGPFQLHTAQAFTPPCIAHLMGVDDLGRDVFTQFMYGARTSLLSGLTAALTAAAIGIVVGTVAGYYGGILDNLLMRITEIVMIIPSFFLALVLISVLGPSILNIIFVIGILQWTNMARLVRSEMVSIKELGFVEALRMLGVSKFRILFLEILPNMLGLVFVTTSYGVAQAMLLEVYLSFLGLGDPSVASWGHMMMSNKVFLMQAWWTLFFPGIGILITILSVNLLGDGLNEITKRRGVH